jgi:hypothetical protein
MRKTSEQQPKRLQINENGSWRWRWNIEEELIPGEEGSEDKTLYSYDELEGSGEPTLKNVTDSLVLSLWSIETQMELVTNYLEAKEGLLNVAYTQPFIDFSKRRDRIKRDISKYFVEHGLFKS